MRCLYSQDIQYGDVIVLHCLVRNNDVTQISIECSLTTGFTPLFHDNPSVVLKMETLLNAKTFVFRS